MAGEPVSLWVLVQLTDELMSLEAVDDANPVEALARAYQAWPNAREITPLAAEAVEDAKRRRGS